MEGLEPTTIRLKARCSTNWATYPLLLISTIFFKRGIFMLNFFFACFIDFSEEEWSPFVRSRLHSVELNRSYYGYRTVCLLPQKLIFRTPKELVKQSLTKTQLTVLTTAECLCDWFIENLQKQPREKRSAYALFVLLVVSFLLRVLLLRSLCFGAEQAVATLQGVFF